MPRMVLLDVGHDGAALPALASLTERPRIPVQASQTGQVLQSPTLCRLEVKGCPLPDFYSGATGIPGRFRKGLLLRGLHSPPDHVGGPLLTSGRVGHYRFLEGVRALPRLEVTLTLGALALGALVFLACLMAARSSLAKVLASSA
jgi:hypothetical protein